MTNSRGSLQHWWVIDYSTAAWIEFEAWVINREMISGILFHADGAISDRLAAKARRRTVNHSEWRGRQSQEARLKEITIGECVIRFHVSPFDFAIPRLEQWFWKTIYIYLRCTLTLPLIQKRSFYFEALLASPCFLFSSVMCKRIEKLYGI